MTEAGRGAGRRADEGGATLVEYLLLVAFIACACMLALQHVGSSGSQTVRVMAARITAQPQASGILDSTCNDTGSCHIRVPDPNRAYVYVWTLPNGSTITQHCSSGGPCGWVAVTNPDPGQPFSVSVRGYDANGPQYAATMMCWATTRNTGTGAYTYSCA